jgi:hypothetical protein
MAGVTRWWRSLDFHKAGAFGLTASPTIGHPTEGKVLVYAKPASLPIDQQVQSIGLMILERYFVSSFLIALSSTRRFSVIFG